MSKNQAGPTITNQARHQRIIGLLGDIAKEDEAFKETLQESIDNGDLVPAAEFPLKLQQYANAHSLKKSNAEAALQDEIDQLPKAGMAGAPDESNLLCLLLEMMDAKKVVEVGVFRGITTLAFAQTLQKLGNMSGDGTSRKVVGLDVSEEFATVGQKYWEKAGVDGLIDFRVGDAKESLGKLLEEEAYGENSVDMCFIDADKTSYDEYYEKCLRLTKPGGLVVVDNVLWGGGVLIPDEVLDAIEKVPEKNDLIAATRSADTKAVKDLNDKISKDNRVERVVFLTVADGVTICRKK